MMISYLAYSVLLTFALSLGGTYVLIMLSKSFGFGLDQTSGIQKFHSHPTPRTGGAALYGAIIAGFYLCIHLSGMAPEQALFYKFFIVSTIPVFVGGITEDLAGTVSVMSRFLLSVSSAIIAYFAINAVIMRTSVDWLDYLLLFRYVSLPLTILAISAVCNGYNMIDGLNGNALGHFIISGFTAFLIAFGIGDEVVAVLAFIPVAAALGVFIFNFPKGNIFLGDAGAYFLGFVNAVISIMLISRNPNVSPWTAVILIGYPFTEVAFSFIRRLSGRKSPFRPDNLHIHAIIYRILKNKYPLSRYNNPLASSAIMLMNAPFILAAYFFIGSSYAVFALTLFYMTGYLALYYFLCANQPSEQRAVDKKSGKRKE